MKRTALTALEQWKKSPRRKPMLLMGARQVGKTWLMQEFGRKHYKQTAYIRLDRDEEMRRIFESNTGNPEILLRNLQARVGFRITPEDTLIILDEIQECPAGLTALKYFCEDAREYHIIAAGSLLGIHQHNGTGFPVGKVNMMTLYPMSFTEFLAAMGKEILSEELKNRNLALIHNFSQTLTELLRLYYYIGGMPEVVETYRNTQDFNQVREVQHEILGSYTNDFRKHIPPSLSAKVNLLWESIPRQLAKENKRFIYSEVQKNMRAKDLEDALDWLKRAGLIYRIQRVSKPAIPLNPYEDGAFKLFFLDVGLLGAKTDLNVSTLLKGNQIFQEFKGALTEQYVQQQLRAECNISPYYWVSESLRAELDFLFHYNMEIVPVEVKAELNLQAKSLKSYCRKFTPALAIRTSMHEYFRQEIAVGEGKTTTLIDLPLYSLCTLKTECDDALTGRNYSS